MLLNSDPTSLANLTQIVPVESLWQKATYCIHSASWQFLGLSLSRPLSVSGSERARERERERERDQGTYIPLFLPSSLDRPCT